MSPSHLLIIAGLDPSGGAGLIADTRVADAHGLRPIGVVTAVTVQNSSGVQAMEPVGPEVVADQLSALLGDSEVAAVKIGMLGSDAHAEAIARTLDQTGAPVVWDPVVSPSAGSTPLYAGHPRRALELLSRHLTLMTPNLAEAALLTGKEVETLDQMRWAAAALAASGTAALVTGGHLEGDPIDVLASGGGVVELPGQRIDCGDVHGTGCALSTALACQLAVGTELAEACRRAAAWVRERLVATVRPGRGRPSVL